MWAMENAICLRNTQNGLRCHLRCSPVGFRSKGLKKSTPKRINPFRVMASDGTAKLITFLGKGGAGKSTSAVLAAKFYAKTGLRTCLVFQSQDPSAEFLLGQKLGSGPTPVGDGTLQAFRLESTQMLLKPLARLKKADASLNLSQGVLDEIVGEELGVLPGMDSILAVAELERLTKFTGGIQSKDKATNSNFDIIIYDGTSSEETLRMVGAAERSRWYLRYIRNLAEKTDLGRVTAPSLLRLTEASLKIDNPSASNGQTSAELWDTAERVLEKGSNAVLDPSRFSAYIVMDPADPLSLRAAFRYWGCAIQAGTHVAGALYQDSPSLESVKEKIKIDFSPLRTASLPLLSMYSTINWDTVLDNLSWDFRELLKDDTRKNSFLPVAFDQNKKMITLFLPGFEKTEIKLSQWKGGSALLVEAGDQRRNIALPSNMRGKVSSARFDKSHLYITLK